MADKDLIRLEKAWRKKVLREAGNIVAQGTRRLIRAGSRKKGKHVTSAPGTPPNSRTGTLARSIKVKVNSRGSSVAITDSARYALALEAGSSGLGRRKQAARPYLSVELEQDKPELLALVAQAIKQGITLRQLKKDLKP